MRIELAPDLVRDIHEDGGTILGSSRGPQEAAVMVDRLVELGLGVLFVIGGDGSIRGALAIAAEIERRQLPIAVIGVPKTIDNDLLLLDRSFGFETAYSEAVASIEGAHREAWGAPGGIGIVKLMGRHSGFIAALATLATSHVNVCLVPEIPFELEGRNGLLRTLQRRLEQRGHAVLVVAEGAGQRLFAQKSGRDASGNVELHDIGTLLVERIREHCQSVAVEATIKYIDPSYIIRSVPARPPDAVLCWRLAQNAVHAALSGRTAMVVGERHRRLVHLPMAAVVAGRRQIEPDGDLWLSVLENTGQPAVMG
jgi:6-phosphofructokinase 1